ncbi:MAG: hypothetical protein JWN31_2207 [Frankiales bacterium]|nr:hypothetical protein [Frankiales bacterium]
MSAEDRLRDILKTDASSVVPSGDGLALIRERVASRRRLRLRLLLVPAGALVTVAVIVVVFALTESPATEQLNGPTSPGATSTTPSTTMAAPYAGPMLWPFTSRAQMDAWQKDHGNRPWAHDQLQVSAHFATDLLGLRGLNAHAFGVHLAVLRTGEQRDQVQLRAGRRVVSTLDLIKLRVGGSWTVIDARGGDLTITAPQAGTAVTSPTQVSGRITGVDENVQLQLITATGHLLATSGAPAGTEMPWNGTLTWSDQTWFTAGIVGITRSSKDGSITRIAGIAVKRGHA